MRKLQTIFKSTIIYGHVSHKTNVPKTFGERIGTALHQSYN